MTPGNARQTVIMINRRRTRGNRARERVLEYRGSENARIFRFLTLRKTLSPVGFEKSTNMLIIIIIKKSNNNNRNGNNNTTRRRISNTVR